MGRHPNRNRPRRDPVSGLGRALPAIARAIRGRTPTVTGRPSARGYVARWHRTRDDPVLGIEKAHRGNNQAVGGRTETAATQPSARGYVARRPGGARSVPPLGPQRGGEAQSRFKQSGNS